MTISPGRKRPSWKTRPGRARSSARCAKGPRRSSSTAVITSSPPPARAGRRTRRTARWRTTFSAPTNRAATLHRGRRGKNLRNSEHVRPARAGAAGEIYFHRGRMASAEPAGLALRLAAVEPGHERRVHPPLAEPLGSVPLRREEIIFVSGLNRPRAADWGQSARRKRARADSRRKPPSRAGRFAGTDNPL